MPKNKIEDGKILIVDDEPGNIRVFERVLKGAGFSNVMSTTDSRKAVDCYREFEPDLILLDLKMPHMDGFGVMQALREVNGQMEEENYLPILVLTAQRETSTRIRALESGAKDFLSKPFEMTEAVTRVRNMLEVRLLYNEVLDQNFNLEYKVKARTRELEESRLEVIHRLARAVEYKYKEPGHGIRMSQFSSQLAEEIGLDREQCELIHHASPLHDIGVIGVSDEILQSPEDLTSDEWEAMKMHPLIGAEILSGSNSKLLQMAESICRSHHEKWNGSGYPEGLKGEDIPIEARIVSICDCFDALTSNRFYRKAGPVEQAVEILELNKGIDFDPNLIDAFLRVLPEMEEIRKQFTDEDHSEILKQFRSSVT